jgi:hypothetical protein
MLEPFISSRIRRTLLEYLLLHPDHRFYLRGLAKELGLAISPLRRELKRLEQVGMLQSAQEGNILFYTVNTASLQFLQLKQAGQPLPSHEDVPQKEPSQDVLPLQREHLESTPRTSQAILEPSGVVVSRVPLWRRPLRNSMLIGVAAVGMAVMLIMAGSIYRTLTNQSLVRNTSRGVGTETSKVTVIVPRHSASGTMRGARWQIVPGGFGGFSSASSSEAF